MPNFGVLPQSLTLLAQATQTTTGNSANLTIVPMASSFRLKVQVNTASGTSPTLVVGLATSSDGGTTYDQILSTTTMTTTGQGAQLLIRPYMGVGDAATQQPTALLGTASLAAAVVNNGPINPQFVKVFWVLGGTTPSFSFKVLLDALPQDLSD